MGEGSRQPAAPLPRRFRSGRPAKGGPQKAVDIDMDWESEAAELAQEEASLEVRNTFCQHECNMLHGDLTSFWCAFWQRYCP